MSGLMNNKPTTTAGPHSSNTANKLDPRVDSDLDGSRNAGMTGAHGTGTHTGMHGSTNAGPHSTNLANKADPRIDSDLDGRGTAGTNTGAYGSRHTGGTGGYTLNSGTQTGAHTGTHAAGTHTGTTTSGPHKSNMANKVDPRVDSDRDHRGNRAATYTGPAPNTAGPHKSDLLNKLDPRVDSDLDGSKTIGGNQTVTGTEGRY